MTARVESLHLSSAHDFSKSSATQLELVAGVGVVGDAHAGAQVQHRSRVAADPTQPNLRQVHLIHGELFADLETKGHRVQPGDLGENVTTTGVDLLALPVGASLSIGADVVVSVTGLRNPCGQIEAFQTGLLSQVRQTNAQGEVVKLSGIMGVVVRGGTIRVGDGIEVGLPGGPRHALERV